MTLVASVHIIPAAASATAGIAAGANAVSPKQQASDDQKQHHSADDKQKRAVKELGQLGAAQEIVHGVTRVGWLKHGHPGRTFQHFPPTVPTFGAGVSRTDP